MYRLLIHEICNNSRFIKIKEDISWTNGLCSEVVYLFVYALLDVLSCSPACHKRQRNSSVLYRINYTSCNCIIGKNNCGVCMYTGAVL